MKLWKEIIPFLIYNFNMDLKHFYFDISISWFLAIREFVEKQGLLGLNRSQHMFKQYFLVWNAPLHNKRSIS